MDSAYCWSICSSNTTSLNHESRSGFLLGLLLFSFSFHGVCANEHIQIYFSVSNLNGSDLVLKAVLFGFLCSCSNEVWKTKIVGANAENLNAYRALAPGVRYKKKEILLVRKSWPGYDCEGLDTYICIDIYMVVLYNHTYEICRDALYLMSSMAVLDWGSSSYLIVNVGRAFLQLCQIR